MKFNPVTPVLLSLFMWSTTAFCQDTAKALDRLYGPDQTLFNGKRYGYYPQPRTKGHQFLHSPAFMEGSVTVRGTCYPGVDLNYDIYNQFLLMYCKGQCGGVNILEVSQAWLGGFTLGEKRFQRLDIGQGSLIYQVLGEGAVRILYHWRKNLELENTVGSANYAFSSPIREAFLLRDGRSERFSNRRNLIRLFSPEQKATIRNYLHRQRIRLKRASDGEMTALAAVIEHLK